MASTEADALATATRHLLAGKYFQIAAFVMLVYDHALTFPQEVERVWQEKFSGVTLLFLLNRCITPLQFIIIINAFQDPIWTKKACNEYVVFEGASMAVLVAICEMIMILRVFALYKRSLVVLAFLLALWSAQIAFAAVSLHTGFAVPLPLFLVGCILTGSSPLFSLIWVGPLVTDTCIFALTLWRTWSFIGRSGTPTIHLFMRDGLLYFMVIFMANLLNTIIYFAAPADLKAVGASFSQLITALMVSRLVLNLRSVSATPDSTTLGSCNLPWAAGNPATTINDLVSRTIGNLGEDFEVNYEPHERVKDEHDEYSMNIVPRNGV